MIPIDKEKTDWNRIRTEYKTGTASLRDLSKKYGVVWSTLRSRAFRENWGKDRKEAQAKFEQSAVRKIEKKISDNATLAADIRRKGLIILDNLFDDFAQINATEHKEYKKGVTDIKRLRDLTAAYKDLTDDMTKPETDLNPVLKSLFNLMNEGRSNGN